VTFGDEPPRSVDVLVPTFSRQGALAITLAGVAGQREVDFRVIVSSQDESDPPWAPEVLAIRRVLEANGRPVELLRHLPRRGLAEHRQFLFDRSNAPAVLFLDDDVWLEPDTLASMLDLLRREGGGFVGSAPHGPSFVDDVRPHEEAIELWDGPVHAERVRPGGPRWGRHRLHNAANLLHVQRHLGLAPGEHRAYHVAWVGGCVLYDSAALREIGAFTFWRELPPEHAGEDVLAQLRVLEARGGCGMVPSGAYHLELPTTIPDRTVDAPLHLAV
jgi:GT2 family glycosyltransferase